MRKPEFWSSNDRFVINTEFFLELESSREGFGMLDCTEAFPSELQTLQWLLYGVGWVTESRRMGWPGRRRRGRSRCRSTLCSLKCGFQPSGVQSELFEQCTNDFVVSRRNVGCRFRKDLVNVDMEVVDNCFRIPGKYTGI